MIYSHLRKHEISYEVMFILRKVNYVVLVLLILSGFMFSHSDAHGASEFPTAGIVSVNSGRLNVRSSAASNSTVLSKLNDGEYVTLHSFNGTWWYVEYGKNQFGYCRSTYIDNIGGNARKAYTTSGTLNVRSGPGTNHAVMGSIKSGEKLVVLSSSAYWSKVLYHGNKIGYVYNNYLGPVAGYSTNSSVSLNVPSYKQYDSRWANVKIGSYGKTMKQIGCATTAIAMMESYRLGKTITPADMSYRLGYTPSGAVYWPNEYTAVTNSINYLQTIYSYLKAGKPVLLGLKNTSGSQHWVVVKGFAGGNMSAANFYINDPGSGGRYNLQQVLNVYPQFYKYFVY